MEDQQIKKHISTIIEINTKAKGRCTINSNGGWGTFPRAGDAKCGFPERSNLSSFSAEEELTVGRDDERRAGRARGCGAGVAVVRSSVRPRHHGLHAEHTPQRCLLQASSVLGSPWIAYLSESQSLKVHDTPRRGGPAEGADQLLSKTFLC